MKECFEKLEEVFAEAIPSKPTPFEKFCLDRLDQFRRFIRERLSHRLPPSGKLQQLVAMILKLHQPNQRGIVALMAIRSRLK